MILRSVFANTGLKIHNTGNFLPWHRWFTYAYEQTLRNECGYKGYHPYVPGTSHTFLAFSNMALDTTTGHDGPMTH